MASLSRTENLERLRSRTVWDLVVIGGGATGLGAAVDAASRGHTTLLLEAHDFAQATSSRSTKLIHGGVRYLAQGNVPLVREALHERGILLRIAPHLVHNRDFVVPAYRWTDIPFYGIGLKLYDALAGSLGVGSSRWIGPAVCTAASFTPTVNLTTRAWQSPSPAQPLISVPQSSITRPSQVFSVPEPALQA